MEEENWVAVKRIEQPSKGWWTYVFKEDDTYRLRVKRMKIFEFEPTGNTACYCQKIMVMCSSIVILE